MRLSEAKVVSATWGARCGRSARRVLRGGTGTRCYAGSVRPLLERAALARLRQGYRSKASPYQP